MTPSKIESATFQFIVQCLNQLHHCKLHKEGGATNEITEKCGIGTLPHIISWKRDYILW
jgi:hypothetical protein